MEILLLGLTAAMLIRDTLFDDELPDAPLCVKIFYALLTGYAVMHIVIMKGWLALPTHYDSFVALFGGAAQSLTNYLNPEG